MKQQQRQLLQSIQQNYNNEAYLHQALASKGGLYVSETNTSQQIFLQKLVNIYVLRKKQYNKINQQRIQKIIKQNNGSFTDLLLGLRYMSYCMQNKIQVSYQKFGMLKLLTNWMDVFERIKTLPKVDLMISVFSAAHPENHTISTNQELLVYINYIAVDLQAILQRPTSRSSNSISDSTNLIQGDASQTQYSYEHLDTDDFLNFIQTILPKTLYNIVIPQYFISGRPMTTTNPADQKQRDFLFSSKSLEYFAKQKNHFQHLLKLMISIASKFNLTQSQQKTLMLIGFKYFYLFNREKLQEPFSLFTKIYQSISEAVKFALSDEFILFFRVIKKLGHNKFIKFLKQKYDWIDNLLSKIDSKSIVGHPKDSLNPFHSLSIMQHIHLSPGETKQRFIQVLEPYSLFYFYIGVQNLDINIRLYYMGPFTSSVEKKQLLINKQKSQVQFKGNIIALQKGIYMFQFDNTYSWMKGKSIFYETVILTPIQITKNSLQKQKFLPVLFNKFEMNHCSQENKIDVADLWNAQFLKSPSVKQDNQKSSQQKSNVFIQNQRQKTYVNIEFFGETKTYNLKSMSGGSRYEYQTQNPDLLIKKANQLFQVNRQIESQWYLNGAFKLNNLQILGSWCYDPLNFKYSEQNQSPVNQESEYQSEKNVFKKIQIIGSQSERNDVSRQVNEVKEQLQNTQKAEQGPQNIEQQNNLQRAQNEVSRQRISQNLRLRQQQSGNYQQQQQISIANNVNSIISRIEQQQQQQDAIQTYINAAKSVDAAETNVQGTNEKASPNIMQKQLHDNQLRQQSSVQQQNSAQQQKIYNQNVQHMTQNINRNQKQQNDQSQNIQKQESTEIQASKDQKQELTEVQPPKDQKQQSSKVQLPQDQKQQSIKVKLPQDQKQGSTEADRPQNQKQEHTQGQSQNQNQK